MPASGWVVSVNVGAPRRVEWHGRRVVTAIWKSPTTGRVPVRGVNLAGDDQADRRVHGGPDKAVYAYAIEDYAWWTEELERDITAGTFGENLTVKGIRLNDAAMGERWRIGDVILEVTQPRMPCFKLGIRMRDAAFVERFRHARRPGAYLRIVEGGTIAAGDEITVVAAEEPAVRIAELLGELPVPNGERQSGR